MYHGAFTPVDLADTESGHAPQIIREPPRASLWGQCTVGLISPLVSSSQKAALPHKTAQRSFHWTITHSATGPASNPCVGAQTPIAHSQFVAVREASLLQPNPQSCCLQSFADGSCCKVDALLLHRRPKICGGQPTVGQAHPHQYAVHPEATLKCMCLQK